MIRNVVRAFWIVCVILIGAAIPAIAQIPGLTLPPSGDNQRSIVTQYIGPVSITINYSSPNVHAPDGTDRRGKIWGDLVPWGMSNLGFGTCGDQCPWRAGSNENTVVTFSHDVSIQGKPLKAGAYGLHMLPGQTEWTIIFSNNSTSWGSFTYNAKEDALRVTAKPEKNEYNEWLTYEFTDRQPDRATVALKWEELRLPFEVKVDKIDDIYVAKVSEELRSNPGFYWQSWDAAAQYALQSKSHLDTGLRWAEGATSMPFIGQENFTTLMTLSLLQDANGKTAEATKTRDKALNHPTAGPVQLHQFARQLQAQKKTEEAIRVFELNAKRFPNQWPVEVGLMRAYSAKGQYKEALKHAKIAVQQAPDDVNRKNLTGMIPVLEQGKDIN